MSRMQQLLNDAADAFDDGRDPFQHDWLSEREVTLDECWELGYIIAARIRFFDEVRGVLSPAGKVLANTVQPRGRA